MARLRNVIRHVGKVEDKDDAARQVVLADCILWSSKSCKDQWRMRQGKG